ncbi:hypothetical protein Taro_016536 [Colocasia esculenta]|uniref:Uncharacterized protein n=1 Tax=Colocasia esculenta TaxID=4460 RepID=A0A843UQJ7_COLES|nr:hypothetical protein [Colocasia esculenta]
MTAVKDIWKEGGVLGFFRGNGLNVMKVAPESAIKFYTFEMLKDIIVNLKGGDKADIGASGRLIAGGMAGAVAQTTIYPMDLIKTRLQTFACEGGKVPNVGKLSKDIWVQEGPRAFYRGLVPSLLGMIPYAGIDLAAYETLKDFSRTYILKDSEPGPLVQLGCGTVSGALGASCVYPLQVIRTSLAPALRLPPSLSILQAQGWHRQPRSPQTPTSSTVATFGIAALASLLITLTLQASNHRHSPKHVLSSAATGGGTVGGTSSQLQKIRPRRRSWLPGQTHRLPLPSSGQEESRARAQEEGEECSHGRAEGFDADQMWGYGGGLGMGKVEGLLLWNLISASSGSVVWAENLTPIDSLVEKEMGEDVAFRIYSRSAKQSKELCSAEGESFEGGFGDLVPVAHVPTCSRREEAVWSVENAD